MRRFLLAIAMTVAVVSGCGRSSSNKPINLIMETDIGNDIDDALAMDIIYKAMDAGKVNLLGVCINKEGTAPGEFIDILNTWYGHPEVPIGIIHNGPDCSRDALNYAKVVVEMKNPQGKQAFERTLEDHENLPEAVTLYRKILAGAARKSVVIASVGFSTNLERLLDSGPDEYSKKTGKELVEKKVKLLVTMAGNFENPKAHEYNVVKDIPAAKKVFEEWPTPVVTSPWELGSKVKYPATSIENDFNWAGLHPMVEAYKAYMEMPYDRETWDPTAVLYALEGEKWFTLSESGTIKVSDEGSTLFKPKKKGTRRYLVVDDGQAEAIKAHFIEIITSPPSNRK